MINRNYCVFFLFIVLQSCISGQKLKKGDQAIVGSLRNHVTYLADDKLEGRRAGTNGEKLAAEYISNQFQKIGLQGKGENDGWQQRFDIYDGREINSASHLFIDGHDLKLKTEYFPLSFSANSSTEAAVSIALAEQGVPWFFDVHEVIDENKDNPHFDLLAAIKSKAIHAAGKGATALFVYNSAATADKIQFDPKDRTELLKIPVVYISSDARKKYLSDEAATHDIKLKVDVGARYRTGNNVIGYINNNAPNTVIIGAHYDHLGFGEDGNSLFRTGEKQIHNGADDNASGTAVMIELARYLKNSKLKNHNYLFIAFSAEELGLQGSKYFTEHPTIDLSKVNYMINLDMVGRLNDSTKIVTVGGYGTSPLWSEVYRSFDKSNDLKFKFDSSGTGPSDHTSFYRKNIPVLFYFTNVHSDYHKPTDDANKINYVGQLMIIRHIVDVLEETNNRPKLAFSPTSERQMTPTRFTVSLGIMPDYSFSGSGVRVDAVTVGRIAEKAGMRTGDIIVQLGDHETSSVETYMQALSKFKKGDATTVKYKRGNEVLQANVTF